MKKKKMINIYDAHDLPIGRAKEKRKRLRSGRQQRKPKTEIEIRSSR